MLRQLPQVDDPNLLTAAIPFADAGVYRLSDECALVQSVDFFTPIVDDPATFGLIAAANALSDIFAMGGKPLTAMNLIGFPTCLDRQLLVEILKAGAAKVHEAGAVIVGGHTVEDDEPKYGLAVTGLVHPDKLISTVGAQPGDVLILTKPLGTGILATALKGEVITENDMADAILSMSTLNKAAAEAMACVDTHACTDITGFGLLGHMVELAEASQIGIALDSEALPIFPQVLDMAAIGLVPVGSYRNREHYLPNVVNREEIDMDIVDVIADPQTSGGLLIAVPAAQQDQLLEELSKRLTTGFVIGQVLEDSVGQIRID